MILDSIQKTLRAYFDPEHVDAMDIYYCMDGDRSLELANLNVVLPLDQPYTHASFESLLSAQR